MVSPREGVSLQRSITLTILLIGVLSGTLGLSFSYWHAKQTIRTTIGLHFRELARHSSDKLTLILTKEIDWIERLSVMPDVRNAITYGDRLSLNRPELKKWRENQRRYYRSLALVTRKGRLAGGITSQRTQAYYTQQPWWPVVFELGRPWAGAIQAAPTGKGFWEVVVPIRHEDQSVIGALKVSVGTDRLFDPALRLRIGETGNIMLVDAFGSVLLSPTLPPSLPTRIEALTDRINQAGPNWFEVQDDGHGNQGGIIGMAPITLATPIVQEQTWQVVVRQDPEETFAPIYSLMWKLGGFWLVVTVLLALLGSRLTRRIVQPLNALIERVPFLGEDQAPPPMKFRGPQEIQTLSDSFNELAERLQVAKQETQRYVQELEQANRELSVSEDHYRTLWDHAVDSMLIIGIDGMIRDMNRRAEITLSQPAGQLVGTALATLVIEEDRPHVVQCIDQVFITGNEQTGDHMHVRLPSGSLLTMEVDLVPMVRAGSMTAVLVQLTDITEKRLLEQQLLRSERLASLSQFASMFAHDIRNPLAGTKKTLELLSHRPELNREPVQQLVKDLQFTADMLLGMINDMLDVYQESYAGLPLHISHFPVGPLLEEVAHLFKGEAQATSVTIQVVERGEALVLSGDRRRLQRMVINLVHNALKYSPTGSTVTLSISCRQDPLSKPSNDGFQTSDLMIAIEDEGPGVDPAELPYLFEMFFRKKDGKDLRIGRGLGLHFCKLIVEAHHGQIWVENRQHGGAKFCVVLPLGPRESTDVDQACDRRGSTSVPAEFTASA